jgi:hypothetical protein
MPKLLSIVSVLVCGSQLYGGGAHAALRVGNTNVMTSSANAAKPYGLRSGEAGSLEPQFLPPKASFDGRLFRR